MQPNFIIFLTDDQGYGDLSCMGATDSKPRISIEWQQRECGSQIGTRIHLSVLLRVPHC